jgi:hypothetical protein
MNLLIEEMRKYAGIITEASAAKTGDFLVKNIEKMFKDESQMSKVEFLNLCKQYLPQLSKIGIEQFQADLPSYYNKIEGDIVNKIIAYICIRCSSYSKAKNFFEKYGKKIGYNPQILEKATKLAQTSAQSLSQAQANTSN